MRYFYVLCLFACWSVYGQALNWPRDLNNAPAANAIDNSTIKTLINTLLAPESMVVDAVGEFRFVPLETVGRVDLIASIDTSGRGMFNALVAIWQSAGAYRYAILPFGGRLARDVVDLDGTGVHEVIGGAVPGPYLGADSIEIGWSAVYRLKDGKWLDVSDKYPNALFDETSLRVRLVAEACLSGDKALVERYRDYALFVTYKTDRLTRHQVGPSLTAALKWAESADPVIQWLAVETLAETPGAQAMSALKKLASAPDKGVSGYAKNVLSHMESGTERK